MIKLNMAEGNNKQTFKHIQEALKKSSNLRQLFLMRNNSRPLASLSHSLTSYSYAHSTCKHILAKAN